MSVVITKLDPFYLLSLWIIFILLETLFGFMEKKYEKTKDESEEGMKNYLMFKRAFKYFPMIYVVIILLLLL